MSYIGSTPTTQAFSPAVDIFSGNGSATVLSLSKPVLSAAQVQVVVNNVPQNPASAFTVGSQTITFTSAPSAGTNNIYVYYVSPITQTIAPSQGTVSTSSLTSTFVLPVVSGGTGVSTSTGSGSVVLGTSPTITTPTINQLTSAATTALTLQSAGTTAVTVDTSQNVGIGTTSPLSASQLTVASKSLSITGSDGNFSSGGARAMVDFTGGTQMRVGPLDGGTATATTLAFLTSPGSVGGNERMRIDSSGQLILKRTAAVNAASFVCSAGQNSRAVSFVNNTNNNEVGYIFLNNDGTTTQYATSSDYRLKENISPMTSALSVIAQLKPVTYKWKINGADGQGFIAHELQSVVPDCVTGEKDGVETYIDEDGNEQVRPKYQGIDTSFLVATLTAAIQELKALTDTQASTITALTARITALENK